MKPRGTGGLVASRLSVNLERMMTLAREARVMCLYRAGLSFQEQMVCSVVRYDIWRFVKAEGRQTIAIV